MKLIKTWTYLDQDHKERRIQEFGIEVSPEELEAIISYLSKIFDSPIYFSTINEEK